jgi:hypothetical protein
MNLFIVEKPAAAHALVEAGVAVRGDMFVSIHSYGLWTPTRRRVELSDVPYTGDVRLCGRNKVIDHYTRFSWRGNEFRSIGIKLHYHALMHIYGMVGRAQQQITGMYALCSTDRIGAYAVKSFLCMFTDKCTLPELKWLNAYSYDPNTLKEVWDKKIITPLDEIEEMSEQRALEIEFNTLWNINSSAVFGELKNKLRFCAKRVLSKDEIMVLHAINQKENINTIDFSTSLRIWIGSGKYPQSDEVSVGSVFAGQFEVIGPLIDEGFINTEGSKIALTKNGKALLSYMHPKTYDPDLPFRVMKWMKESDKESMHRYIRTIFGRQLIYQRNHDGDKFQLISQTTKLE